MTGEKEIPTQKKMGKLVLATATLMSGVRNGEIPYDQALDHLRKFDASAPKRIMLLLECGTITLRLITVRSLGFRRTVSRQRILDAAAERGLMFIPRHVPLPMEYPIIGSAELVWMINNPNQRKAFGRGAYIENGTYEKPMKSHRTDHESTWIPRTYFMFVEPLPGDVDTSHIERISPYG